MEEHHIRQDNKRIAKNTVALYVRLLFVMVVTLFTSRIILEKLGVTAFGVYSAVGGVVTMFTFLNGTLSTGTSRFLTYEMGTGDTEKLHNTFSTAFFIHLFFALGVTVLLAVVGTWFVLTRMVIPPDLRIPGLITFYISAFTAFMSIAQVPYTSIIIARERMAIYAYIGIFEAVARLGVAYAISLAPINMLVWYALLVAGVQLIVAVIYIIYCVRRYDESHVHRTFKRDIFRSMARFTGQNFVTNITEFLSTQGLVVLINMFFAPAVAAAQAVGAQVSAVLNRFATNFMTAINPQIIKLYASGDRAASRLLNLQSTVYIWDLMLLIGLPLIVCMQPLINIWLVDIPPYAIIFSQYIVAREILNTFSLTFFVPMIAAGRLKENSIACIWLGVGEYLILYLMLRMGMSVMWVQYMSILQAVAFGFCVKPWILCRHLDYAWRDMMHCYLACAKVALMPVALSIVLSLLANPADSMLIMCIDGVAVMLCVAGSALLFMGRDARKHLMAMIRSKI